MSRSVPPLPPTPAQEAGSAAPLLGRRYSFLARLGEGAGGVSDLVQDSRTGVRRVAKRVSLDDFGACAHLRREYALRARLHHPLIPRPLDLGVDAGQQVLYLINEYAPGDTLDLVLGEAKPEHAQALLAMALTALAHVHARGVLHRDLKPHNIVARIDDTGVFLALLDFGLARPRDDAEGAGGGTSGFVAPEVLRGDPSSEASDLFSLGRAFDSALGAGRRSAPLRAVLRVLCEEAVHARVQSASAALAMLTREAPEVVEALPSASAASYRAPEGLWAELLGRAERLTGYGPETPVHLVVGRPGRGRSRLLEELRHTALIRGYHVIACGGEVTRTSLKGLAILVERVGQLGVPGVDLDEVRQVALALHAADDTERVPAGLQRDVARILQESAASHPLLVLIDDLRRTDGPLWGCLRALSSSASGTPPMVVGTVLTEAQGPVVDGDAHEAAGHLDPASALSWHVLPEAEPETVRHVILDVLPAHRDGDAASFVEGVLSLAGTDLRLAALLARAEDPGGVWDQDGAPTLDGLVVRRMEALSADTRFLLQGLALLNVPSRVSFVSRLCDMALEATHRSVIELARAGLLSMEPAEADPRLWVDLRVVRVLALRGLTPESLRARHARVFDVLAAWPHAVDRSRDSLTLHALAAERFEDAITHGREALRILLREGELGAALDLGSRLIKTLPRAASSGYFEVVEAYTDALMRTHQVAEAEACVNRVLPQTQPAALAVHRARFLGKLGAMSLVRGELHRGEMMLTQALEIGGESLHAGDRMYLAERLGAAQFRRAAHVQAQTTWRRGLDEAGGPSHRRVEGDLLNNLAVVAGRLGQPDEARQLYERSLTLRRGIGDLDGESITLANLAMLRAAAGDLDGARTLSEDSCRLAERIGAPARARTGYLNAAEWSLQQGKIDEARTWLTRGQHRDLEVESHRIELFSAQVRFELALFEGQWGAAQQALRAFQARVAGSSEAPTEQVRARGVEGELALQLGDLDRAERVLAQQDDEPDVREGITWAWFLRLRAEAATLRGDTQGALDVLREVGQMRIAATDVRQRMWTDFARAIAIERAGRPREALPLLEGCRRVARTMNSDLQLGRIGVVESRCALRVGDRDAASDLLQDASYRAERIGCAPLQFDVAAQKGRQAYLRGQSRRARAWWQHAGTLVLTSLRTLPDRSHDARALKDPRRAWVFTALEELLQGGSAGSDPGETSS